MSLKIFNNIIFCWLELLFGSDVIFHFFFLLSNQRHAFKQFWSRGISWDIGYRTWMISIQPNKRLKKYLMTISIVRMAVCMYYYLFVSIFQWHFGMRQCFMRFSIKIFCSFCLMDVFRKRHGMKFTHRMDSFSLFPSIL
jgi:hypothetical protein